MMKRDSAIWWVLLIVAVAGFGSTHYELITKAFPDLPMIWQSRLELVSVFGIFLAGYLRMSPLGLYPEGDTAKAGAIAGADPTKTLTMTGKEKPADESTGV